MDHFAYRDGELHAEEVPLRAIAECHGTPAYVYSRATLERHWRAFDAAFADRPHLVCYAVKANSNLAVLNVLARLGSGFDIVSVGELERVLAAGGDPDRVVFSGVGKRADEMARALEVGIRCFNIESVSELARLEAVAAAHGVQAPVALRVNPDVDAKTHPYISTGLRENKFGIDIAQAGDIYRRVADSAYLEVSGIDCHIGSQLTELSPFLDALDRVLELLGRLRDAGIAIDHLDLGGGLGARYRDETPPEPGDYAAALAQRLGDLDCELFVEPGRAIAANAGVLLTCVEYLKRTEARNFAIVDAAMNDLLRPALYQAWQEIVTVEQHPEGETDTWDLVGPVCETGDFLGKDRRLTLREGSLLAVRSAGAYGFTMASNYNSRPRPPELLVDGERVHVARPRETLDDLFGREAVLP
ncbi:diaminopimelate decarboxylase [endosymbiont of unidentified scaly snail isolate Monju]|uniref:diaminopimelate decarboxylase n=1 Tax=endosymbiont of unidentified scaly snail isolate Monju TaxID=1248727 RepID=UPI00038926EA|nr:diaminopimelate decarboxylase [endosymbiont of unidentified scaly snail isolate Monju]BAN68026.1 diaminopimelate decarboxylase [endosymbiont of unidentified scaly snail isolate Monju]